MNSKLLKVSTLSGLLGGFSLCIFFYLSSLFFKNPFAPFPKSLEFFIYLFTVAFFIVYYRFRVNGGKMHFWEGMLGGVWAVLLMMGLFSIIFYLMLTNNPALIQNYQAQHLDFINQNLPAFKEKYGETGLKTIFNNIKNNTTPYRLVVEELYKTPIGLIMTLIIAALLRK